MNKNNNTSLKKWLYAKSLPLTVFLLLVITLPVALFASGQQQQIKQDAASPSSISGVSNPLDCPAGYEFQTTGTNSNTGNLCVPIPSPIKPVCSPVNSDILFVLDVSDSMHGKSGSQTKITAATDAMNFFINLISVVNNVAETNDKIGLVTFGKAAQTDQPLTTNYALLKSVIKQAAGHLEYRTCTECGIDVAKGEEIQDAAMGNNKIAIILSDGEANWTELMQPSQALDAKQGEIASLQAAIRAYKTSGMTFFTIGVGTPGQNADFSFLKKIAEDTGGAFYQTQTADQLNSVFQGISDTIKQNEMTASVNNPANQCSPTPTPVCVPRPVCPPNAICATPNLPAGQVYCPVATPTCTPRPVCKPGQCTIPVPPPGGWCPVATPTCTPEPPQCLPGSNLKIACPAPPSGGWCPNPTPTCTPRPAVTCAGGVNCPVPTTPPGGWCPVIVK